MCKIRMLRFEKLREAIKIGKRVLRPLDVY